MLAEHKIQPELKSQYMKSSLENSVYYWSQVVVTNNSRYTSKIAEKRKRKWRLNQRSNKRKLPPHLQTKCSSTIKKCIQIYIVMKIHNTRVKRKP